MLLRSNFSSFPHYFIHIFLTSRVKLHIHLLNVVVQFIVFLTLSTLICRGTDISKCFSDSLGIRDNESRLYIPCGCNSSYSFPPFSFKLCILILHGLKMCVWFWGYPPIIFYQLFPLFDLVFPGPISI